MIKTFGRFALQFLRSPRNTGGILPSSQKLAETLAEVAGDHFKEGHQVIELGPGTGNITKELRKSLPATTRIHLIENNNAFAEILKRDFPGEALYAKGFEEVDLWASPNPKLIVSSIPWLSLPQEVIEKGLEILTKELVDHPESVLIQYTYGLIDPIPFNDPQILDVPAMFIFLNLPPARIWIYKKKPTKK